jgi:hypothetical protein
MEGEKPRQNNKIRVVVRKRPRNAKELKKNDEDILHKFNEKNVIVQELK